MATVYVSVSVSVFRARACGCQVAVATQMVLMPLQRVGDKLVWSKVRQALGGKVKCLISGLIALCLDLLSICVLAEDAPMTRARTHSHTNTHTHTHTQTHTNTHSRTHVRRVTHTYTYTYTHTHKYIYIYTPGIADIATGLLEGHKK